MIYALVSGAASRSPLKVATSGIVLYRCTLYPAPVSHASRAASLSSRPTCVRSSISMAAITEKLPSQSTKSATFRLNPFRVLCLRAVKSAVNATCDKTTNRGCGKACESLKNISCSRGVSGRRALACSVCAVPCRTPRCVTATTSSNRASVTTIHITFVIESPLGLRGAESTSPVCTLPAEKVESSGVSEANGTQEARTK